MESTQPDPRVPPRPSGPPGASAKADAQVLIGSALLDMDAGHLAEATEALERAKRLDPTNPVTFYTLGIAKARGGDLEGALTDLYAALWLKGDFAQAMNELGIVKLRMKDFAGALRDFMRAAESDPGPGEPPGAEAAAPAGEEEHEVAIRAYDIAIRLRPDSDLLLGRGNARRLAGDRRGAIEDYARAIELNPREARAMVNRGNELVAERRHAEARADFERAIALDPSLADAFNGRGVCRCAQQDYLGAVDDHSHALELDPESTAALFDRANARCMLADYAGAIEDYDQALRQRPNNPEALLMRGNAWSMLQELDKAVSDYSAAIALKPGFAGAYRNRARVLRRMGQVDAARADEQEGLRLEGEPA